MSTVGNGFLDELRTAYTNFLDQRKHLDNKTSSMIGISGTISTLLFGFGTFTLTRIDPKYNLLPFASGILILAIIMIVASALLSLWAFKTERYLQVLSKTIFFIGKNIDERSVQQWENANPEVLQKRMVRDYIRCNRVNSECNASKSRKITWAQVNVNSTLRRILGVCQIKRRNNQINNYCC
ncbi:MAG: hypothetical protein M3297_09115 [Thermoproteota archaeon]|nr:hypothetical protein [Thermoproteota archaeon]